MRVGERIVEGKASIAEVSHICHFDLPLLARMAPECFGFKKVEQISPPFF